MGPPAALRTTKMQRIAVLVLVLFAVTNAVEVHFETADSGFFLKHPPRQPGPNVVSPVNGGSAALEPVSKSTQDQSAVLSVDRFTIVQSTQPVSIRASYGPFSTKQTVPAKFIVPDAAVEAQSENTQQSNASQALLDMQQTNIHLDISAHLVRTTIPRDSPVLRVLFHAGADPGGHMQRQKICVLLHASLENHAPLKGRCMPEGEDGVCLAEVVIPAAWWPPLPTPDKNGRLVTHKVPQKMVQVSYSVYEPPARNPEQCEPKVQIQPLTQMTQVPLVPSLTAYKELRADELLTILIPHQPLYPMSHIHVPVFLQPQAGHNIAVFIVRARVKAGMRILGATASSDQWNISVEKENTKHTVARVMAIRKDQDPDSPNNAADNHDVNQVVEVFTWLLEVANETKDHWDGGRIVWSVSYVHDGPKSKNASSMEVNPSPNPTDEGRRKLVAKLEIHKDDIQAVLPIAKNWELMNTAVLTGRQVSQAMKVFIVSQSGKVADVTLQTSCQAEDESVIKVSSSCSSVYVDGSEARGSPNASIVVKYGTYVGLARFIVWMPEFPLEVSVADFRLSQIKGWKIPDDHASSHHGKKHRRRKRAYTWNKHSEDLVNGLPERSTCRSRYQQSSVEIFARFLAEDQDSGRMTYLISRRTGLRVTDLVQPLLRVADPKIASLRGRILQGRAMGRTDVQVLSPITGRVIGAKEVRVGSDRVTISRLIVRVVSGLQLNITPDNSVENGYLAETSVTRRLTAQYQEGLLDMDLEFSDGSRTPLRDISVDDYLLLVESLDAEVVAFAPMLASHHPRVIAVGEGNGDLLRVTLLLSEECRMRRNVPLLKQGSKASPGPLATALASVQVDFNTFEAPVRSDTVQNDGFLSRDRSRGRDSDLADILIGIPLKDDHHEPTVQARQHRGGVSLQVPGRSGLRHGDIAGDSSFMEIGMYVLMTAFCLAIAIFVAAFFVYASKFRPAAGSDELPDMSLDAIGAGVAGGGGIKILREPRRNRESTQNAHDWVWLGRSTMDRASVITENGTGGAAGNQRDSRIRITNNPITMNYAYPEDVLAEVTCFDNPNHIQLPPTNVNGMVPQAVGVQFDSSTYNKRDRPDSKMSEAPPPLPPHGAEYRPPVPPHRNVGVTANARPSQTRISSSNNQLHPKHHRHSGHSQRPNTDAQRISPSVEDVLVSASDRLRATSRSSIAPSEKRHSHRYSGVSSSGHEDSTVTAAEMHMAEKLVESSAHQQKSVFQFDTLTPVRTWYQPPAAPVGAQEAVSTAGEAAAAAVATHKSSSSSAESSDNGGFVTQSDEDRSLKRIKRATVVGNPMFSTAESGDSDGVAAGSSAADLDDMPTESLGLDDLDMDYEQIMHYFDNLKESNA